MPCRADNRPTAAFSSRPAAAKRRSPASCMSMPPRARSRIWWNGAARPEIGQPVTAKIDWATRYARMRMHTALHLLSAALPYPVTGGSVGDAESRLDFDIPEGGLDKDEITAKLAEMIAADAEVRARWFKLTSSSFPFHLRILPATITVSTLVRSINDTTAPGTLLTGATLSAVASRMMMSASLPGVSVPVLVSSR